MKITNTGWRSAVVFSLFALSACGPGDASDNQSTALTGNESSTFTGSLDAAQTSWVVTNVTIQRPGAVSVTLDWDNAAANLNLFFRDPSGKTVAYQNTTTAKPEKLTYAVPSAGTYSFAIKCKTGKAKYTVSVALTSTGGYPGQPRVGALYWGTASGSFDLASRYEGPTGASLSIHRTYYQWAQRTTGLVTTAQNDLAKNRLPWVSVKTPSWAEMAAGKHDAEIDQMLRALAVLNGPVWLTIYHEPEGGGGHNYPDDPAGPAGHLAMNRQVRARMTALGLKNVALAPILMSYSFTAASGRNPDAWWGTGVYDFFGVDTYASRTGASLLDPSWASVRTWAGARNVDVAAGEWGLEGQDAVAGNLERSWFDAGIASGTDGKGARVVGLCAFDTDGNAAVDGQGWALKGAQLTTFLDLLKDAKVARVR